MKNDLSSRKRMTIGLVLFGIACLILIVRIFILQIVQSKDLRAKADEQQRSSRSIGAKRGIIYDSSGEIVLAVSSTVYTVTVNPMRIPEDKKEALAQKLSEIFELDYDKTLKKLKKKSSIENIVKRQDKEKTDLLRSFMEQNNLYNGINIDEDTKRYYPYSNLASHVIGFCGSDNQGLDGVEAKYDDVLSGKSGEINSLIDAKGQSFGDEGEKYIEPKDRK